MAWAYQLSQQHRSESHKAISLGESNASKIQANFSKIESSDFEIDQLKNKVTSLDEALNKIRVELDDMRNYIKPLTPI